ncbi:MAG: MFS transporter [Nocardiopsaceae bacterium]|nr:MFS transporter [Nocardiopsaceae bacterium]
MRQNRVLLVMCCGMFLVLLDVTIVNVAVPAITTGLRTSTAGVQWVVDGYTVAIASLLLAGGTLGDRLGHKATVLGGLVLFGIASAGCALATAVPELIAARAAQGTGAALLLPGSLAAVADVFPDRAQQAKALGIWAAVSSLALPAGPVLGGFLVSSLGWRAVFWINPPVAMLCVVGVAAWVPRGRPKTARLDWRGLALATTALAAAVYAVIAAGEGAWAPVAVAALVSLAAGTALFVAERIVANPLLPPAVFRRPAFRVANAAALIMNLTSNGLLFVVTRYLQTIQGHSAATAGLMLLAMSVPVPVMAPLAGRATARRGPVPVLVAGAAIAGTGQLCLLLAGASSPYALLFPSLFGVGVGIGIFVSPVVAMSIRAVPPERSGLASGINNTARQVGTALGVAVFGAAAGSPALTSHFITAMHVLGAAAALAWLLVIALVTRSASRNSDLVGVPHRQNRRNDRPTGQYSYKEELE